jgi:hypothetical protein
MSTKLNTNLKAIELTQAELNSVTGGASSISSRRAFSLRSIVAAFEATERANASAWSP